MHEQTPQRARAYSVDLDLRTALARASFAVVMLRFRPSRALGASALVASARFEHHAAHVPHRAE